MEGNFVFEKCPVCKEGTVIKTKTMLGLKTKISCNRCNSEWIERGFSAGTTTTKFELKSDSSKYNKQTLADYEWRRIAEGGLSDLELVLQERKLPTAHIEGLNIILNNLTSPVE